jgi:hypothetical protein
MPLSALTVVLFSTGLSADLNAKIAITAKAKSPEKSNLCFMMNWLCVQI